MRFSRARREDPPDGGADGEHGYLEDNIVRLETAVRDAGSAYLGVRPDELAITGLRPEASAERIVQTVARNLHPATRLVALTWVHSGTGVKLPVRQIAEAVAKLNTGRAPEDRRAPLDRRSPRPRPGGRDRQQPRLRLLHRLTTRRR
jgi:hypothetical protein